MKLRRTVLTAGLLLLSMVGYAQPEPMKWGKIDPADMEMKTYALDTTAKAVILGEYGDAYFTYSNDRGFQLNVVHHVRIKILEQEGTEWANVEIPLYHVGTQSQEKIIGLKGSTYNIEEGKEVRTKLSKSDVFEEAINDRVNIYKFSLPNVKAGSVLEYEYHKVSDFIYGLETWVFQRTIPSRWSEFRTRIPEYYSYKNLMSGHLLLTINESSSYEDNFYYRGTSSEMDGTKEKYEGTLKPEGIKQRWAIKDVPALKDEPYITTLSDYAAKIEFELKYTKYPMQPMKYFSSDWAKLSNEFLEHGHFGGELKKQRQVSELVNIITAGKQKPDEKLAAIYNYVQANIRYNGQERVYTDKNFKEVLAKKEGNAAEINLLLIAMLREAKLNANPVILSTRSHGRVNHIIPMEKDFNYVVCHIAFEDNKYILLDATDPLMPIGMLPYRCLNYQGRIIADDKSSWINLHTVEKTSNTITAKLAIKSDGTMAGTMSYLYDGYDAVYTRRKIITAGEEKYLQDIAATNSHWVIKDNKINNATTVNQKLEENFTLEIKGKTTIAGDKLYVALLPEGVMEKNPFAMDSRGFPVNFGCFMDEMFMYELEIPAGYAVEQLPKITVLTLPDKSAIFRYNVVQMGNKINVTSSLQIKKTIYMPEEYAALKEFYQMMLAKQNEQVVLKKQP